jgi:hypothetical protein
MGKLNFHRHKNQLFHLNLLRDFLKFNIANDEIADVKFEKI